MLSLYGTRDRYICPLKVKQKIWDDCYGNVNLDCVKTTKVSFLCGKGIDSIYDPLKVKQISWDVCYGNEKFEKESKVSFSCGKDIDIIHVY